MKKIAFTSITLNYMPKARVLAQSFKRHHPDVEFYLLVGDDVPAGVNLEFPAFDRIFTLRDLEIRDDKAWLFKHSVVEICTAIKGFFLKQMLADPDIESVLYLDPDIAVFGPLESVYGALDQASIVLTPHLLEAELEQAAIMDNELSALKHGVYNLGFLAVKNTDEGRRFGDWWKHRLEHFCYADIPNGIFTDQRWVDLAPAFFHDLHILRDEACNVAPWNLTKRKVSGSIAEGLRVNGKPLTFYHFSGFDSGANMAMLQRYAQDAPVLFEMHQWYIDSCTTQDTQNFGSMPWSYDFYKNGSRITRGARWLYRTRHELQDRYPNPFDTDDHPASFHRWYQDNEDLSRGELNALDLRSQLDEIYNSRSWKLVKLIKRAKRLLTFQG